jgi:hypothetical protein
MPWAIWTTALGAAPASGSQRKTCTGVPSVAVTVNVVVCMDASSAGLSRRAERAGPASHDPGQARSFSRVDTGIAVVALTTRELAAESCQPR